jgi:hypothetical protein
VSFEPPAAWPLAGMKSPFLAPLIVACLATGAALSAAEGVRATDRMSVDAGRGEFTLVLVPDTQRYAKNNPAMFFSQTNWIRDNVAPLNIRFVIHLGDIVDDNTDQEWRVADQAMGVLDGRVPYLVVPGNHDYELHPERGWRMVRAKVQRRVSAGARPALVRRHKGTTNDNNYVFFSAAGRDLTRLNSSSDEVLQWAVTRRVRMQRSLSPRIATCTTTTRGLDPATTSARTNRKRPITTASRCGKSSSVIIPTSSWSSADT